MAKRSSWRLSEERRLKLQDELGIPLSNAQLRGHPRKGEPSISLLRKRKSFTPEEKYNEVISLVRRNMSATAARKLAEPVAAKRNGKPRGWFKLPADNPVIALRDFIVIPQHAGAQDLKIAWGSVVAFPGAGNRLRYDTTTEHGSSGSPCFTADLDIVGLHHAAEAKHNPTYNQAVPLWLVARDLRQKGVALEAD
jgi:hypothetical protein